MARTNSAKLRSKEQQMSRCLAVTAKGARCVFSVTPPSKSLCGKHLNAADRGSEVRNFETGRKFPAPRR